MCYCSNDHLSAPLPSELLAQPQTDLDSYGFSVVLSLLALFSAACLEINYLLVLFKYASLCRDFAPSFLPFFLFFFSPFFLFFSFLFFFSLNLPPISANRCINLLAKKLKKKLGLHKTQTKKEKRLAACKEAGKGARCRPRTQGVKL